MKLSINKNKDYGWSRARLTRKTDTDKCQMCGVEADDYSGHWYIIKAVGLVSPFGWAHRMKLDKWINEDWLMFSYELSHIICWRHGVPQDGSVNSHMTVHVIDHDSFWEFLTNK